MVEAGPADAAPDDADAAAIGAGDDAAGGCGCRVAGGRRSQLPVALLLGVPGMLAWCRRRRLGRQRA